MELGNNYKAREFQGKMQRRGTSKKRAAEAEKEIEVDMDNKEATPVEAEEVLPPVLSKQTEQPGEQPELPTQTGEVNVQERYVEKSKTAEEIRMDMMMEMFQREFKSLKEDNKKMDENSKGLKEELSGVNKNCLLYTSRCV